MDLLDLYKGDMSPRRCMVLIEGLPPGATLHRRMGGDLAWDDTTRAIHQEIHALRNLVADLFAKTNSGQAEAKPPEPGWMDRAEARAEYERSRVDRLKARAAERRRRAAEARTG